MFLIVGNMDRNIIIFLIWEFKSGIFLILTWMHFEMQDIVFKNLYILALLTYTDSNFWELIICMFQKFLLSGGNFSFEILIINTLSPFFGEIFYSHFD